MSSMADEKGSSKTQNFIDSAAALLDAYPGAGLREIFRLIPDGLFLGIGFLSLITQNYPLAILFLTLLEALLITVGLQNLVGYIGLPDVLPTAASISTKCVSGFQSPTLQMMSLFFKLPVTSSFPSPPIFLATVAYTYVISAMQAFSSELSELGPGFSTRYYVGIFLSFFVLLLLSIFRFLNKCEGMGVIVLSLAFGFLLGLVLAFQNTSLLGKEALNLLGIPYFANRTADGKPIYVCPAATLTPTQ